MQSFPEPGNKYRVSTSGAGGYGTRTLRQWRSDGKEIVYLGRDFRTVMSVEVEAGETFRAGTPRVLFTLPDNITGTVSRDCRNFLVTLPDPATASGTISVITNWTQLLEQ